MSTQFDVAVIGAGPAGSVASALLRKKGYSGLNLNQDKAASLRQYKQYGTDSLGASAP
ncbi:monooxygenase [Neisseria meningitidis]|nr:FAD-dependent monooxygenase [Neisseria meningitidis]RPC03574.1 monooxygenase [Neisseria meningitidis]